MKKAFTLAEILIVLVIIGVLTAILLPIAFQSSPDENVMKFKKANNTLGTIIRELTSSERYYKNGDLGVKPDDTLLIADSKYYTYFCETIAEIVTIKSKNCSEVAGANPYIQLSSTEDAATYTKPSEAKKQLDSYCKAQAATIGAEIVTPDDVVWYQTSPQSTFGKYNTGTTRLYSQPDGKINYPDENGFDRIYKVFCIDIDGIGQGEDPFGYGIRSDGKIFTGARADEWANKSIQQE